MEQRNKSRVISRLRRALDEIPGLKKNRSDNRAFEKWKRNTKVAIEYAFEYNPDRVKEFTRINYGISPEIGDIDVFYPSYKAGLERVEGLLESMIEEVDEYWPDDEVSTSVPVRHPVEPITSNKVFLIHGRDEGTRETIARFLEQLKIEPVILTEQASQGRTIIEKFERHAQVVEYAIALLTPDDAGSLGGGTAASRPRARQNVIFELGFFSGSLGRKRVIALAKGGVEIPSDYSGVVYIALDDSDGWKLKLITELKAAGFHVDANRAL